MDAFSSVSCSSFSCISMVSLSEACGQGRGQLCRGHWQTRVPTAVPSVQPVPWGTAGTDLEHMHELVLGHQVVLLQALGAAPVLADQHVELPQVVAQVLHVLLDVLLLLLLLVDLLCGGERGPREGPVPEAGEQGCASPAPLLPHCPLGAPPWSHPSRAQEEERGSLLAAWFPKPGPLRTWKDQGVASQQVERDEGGHVGSRRAGH